MSRLLTFLLPSGTEFSKVRKHEAGFSPKRCLSMNCVYKLNPVCTSARYGINTVKVSLDSLGLMISLRLVAIFTSQVAFLHLSCVYSRAFSHVVSRRKCIHESSTCCHTEDIGNNGQEVLKSSLQSSFRRHSDRSDFFCGAKEQPFYSSSHLNHRWTSSGNKPNSKTVNTMNMASGKADVTSGNEDNASGRDKVTSVSVSNLEANPVPDKQTLQNGDDHNVSQQASETPSNLVADQAAVKTMDNSNTEGLEDSSVKEEGKGDSLYWRPHSTGEVLYRLTTNSILSLQIGDITKWFVDGKNDAIVNAANKQMLGGGGVDGAIHRAAGPELLRSCLGAPEIYPGVRCPTGEAVLTSAGRLPVKYVIHTVGPIYRSFGRQSDASPAVLLESAHRNSMARATAEGVKYICFPAISCGIYGYPAHEAAPIAVKAVKENAGDVTEVHFMLFERALFEVWNEAAKQLCDPLSPEPPAPSSETQGGDEIQRVSGKAEKGDGKGDEGGSDNTE